MVVKSRIMDGLFMVLRLGLLLLLLSMMLLLLLVLL